MKNPIMSQSLDIVVKDNVNIIRDGLNVESLNSEVLENLIELITASTEDISYKFENSIVARKFFIQLLYLTEPQYKLYQFFTSKYLILKSPFKFKLTDSYLDIHLQDKLKITDNVYVELVFRYSIHKRKCEYLLYYYRSITKDTDSSNMSFISDKFIVIENNLIDHKYLDVISFQELDSKLYFSKFKDLAREYLKKQGIKVIKENRKNVDIKTLSDHKLYEIVNNMILYKENHPKRVFKFATEYDKEQFYIGLLIRNNYNLKSLFNFFSRIFFKLTFTVYDTSIVSKPKLNITTPYIKVLYDIYAKVSFDYFPIRGTYNYNLSFYIKDSKVNRKITETITLDEVDQDLCIREFLQEANKYIEKNELFREEVYLTVVDDMLNMSKNI